MWGAYGGVISGLIFTLTISGLFNRLLSGEPEKPVIKAFTRRQIRLISLSLVLYVAAYITEEYISPHDLTFEGPGITIAYPANMKLTTEYLIDHYKGNETKVLSMALDINLISTPISFDNYGALILRTWEHVDPNTLSSREGRSIAWIHQEEPPDLYGTMNALSEHYMNSPYFNHISTEGIQSTNNGKLLYQ